MEHDVYESIGESHRCVQACEAVEPQGHVRSDRSPGLPVNSSGHDELCGLFMGVSYHTDHVVVEVGVQVQQGA